MFKKRSPLTARSGGFTLIELLIVVVIIGVLAGVVLVLINPARQQRRSKESILKANTNKLCLALYSCATTAGAVGQCDDFTNAEIAADIADLRGRTNDNGTAANDVTLNQGGGTRASSAPAYATYTLTVAGQIVTVNGSLPGSNTNPGGSGAATAANACVFSCSYDFATGDGGALAATVPANCVLQ